MMEKWTNDLETDFSGCALPSSFSRFDVCDSYSLPAALEARFKREKEEQTSRKALTMSEINNRNTKRNFEAMLTLSKQQNLEKRKSLENADPFSRRPTAPKKYDPLLSRDHNLSLSLSDHDHDRIIPGKAKY